VDIFTVHFDLSPPRLCGCSSLSLVYVGTLGKDPTVTQVALVASTIDSFHGLLASVRGVEDADSLEL